MSNVIPMTPTRDYNGSQLALIRRTVAKDTNADEFDMFIQVCRRYGLDPFRKQIYCTVYNKDKPDKRTCSFVTGIDGLRAIAERQGNYRPDEDETVFLYNEDAKGPTNPLGIVKASVRVWKRDKAGDWHPISGGAYWEEFAPLKEEWAEDDKGKRKPTGKKTLDGKFWQTMPRVMLAKCAEAQALRKGWPEDLSGLYATEEMDRQETLASQQVDEQEATERQLLLGGPGIIFQFHPDAPLDSVPVGQVHGRIEQWLLNAEEPDVEWFRSINRVALQEFWAKDKAAALDIKKQLESKIS